MSDLPVDHDAPSPSRLDPAALQRLRRLLTNLPAQPRRTLLDAATLADCAELDLPGRLVVDLASAAELGHPLVILEREPQHPASLDGLTRREREVAALVAAGLANKQIATVLGISQATVKDHVHHILSKTGLPSRAGIAAAVTARPE
jgi:DNA-binding NarL/FixJ family response regulator